MRRPAWLSVRWWSSRSILTVSFCAFAAVLCILLGSNRYMADCVQQEAQAKDELASLIALGQQLADASDLLTNEVRAYAETEDITHLNNYWTEVLATRQRDAVIQTLENDQLPDEEAALLAQAKRCSDLLIDTETRSMYLILAAAGQNADDFPDEPLHRYVTRVTKRRFPVQIQRALPRKSAKPPVKSCTMRRMSGPSMKLCRPSSSSGSRPQIV